jgi:HAD superfamily hydrolase (TIGR01509 family)
MYKPTDIDWILCDLGKTLVNFDHGLAVRGILAHPALQERDDLPTERDVFEFIFHSEEGSNICQALDRGYQDIHWLAMRLRNQWDLHLPLQDIERAWSEIFLDEIPGVQTAMRRAQANGVRVALCSNTNAAHIAQLKRQHPHLLEGWDALFYSYEMGTAKGDQGFFTRIALEVGSPTERLLLVDDLPANILAAEAEGAKGHLFRGQLPGWELWS